MLYIYIYIYIYIGGRRHKWVATGVYTELVGASCPRIAPVSMRSNSFGFMCVLVMEA
jgi:hypothetical protein